MKRILTIISFLSSIVVISAQISPKVGINTTDPQETVHVIGDIILLESPDGTKKVMLRTGGASGELKSLGDLYLRAQGNEIILNHVPTDGNVAIGKTGPTERLDVGGAIRIGTTTNMSSEEGTVKFESGEFQGYDGTEWKSFTDGGNSHWELALDTSTIVYDGGKVIVGSTATPQELEVTDDVMFRGELHMSSLSGANPTFKIVDNGTTFYMGPVRNGSDYYIQTTKDLILRTSGNSYSNKLVVKNDGKVGIGSSVDAATLTEALTVNGGVNIGNTTTTNPGSVRYTSSDGFEGYDDGEWKSITDKDDLDANPTNELQTLADLSDPGSTVQVQISAGNTIDLTNSISQIAGGGAFENSSGTVRNTGDNSMDDFLFGAEQMPENGVAYTAEALLFDKDKIAFRGGKTMNSNDWAPDSIGLQSFSFGNDLKTKGRGAANFGSGNNSDGWFSVTGGTSNDNNGYAAASFGSGNQLEGNFSLAVGNSNTTLGQNSLAMGRENTSSGHTSVAIGEGIEAASGYEVAVGRYNTLYDADNANGWDLDDRLFTVGNGTSSAERHDALTVLKNGDLIINGDEIPQDGVYNGNIAFFSTSLGAFRSGNPWNSNNWNVDSIGEYSVSLGQSTRASGHGSFSTGSYSYARGRNSVALGAGNESIGDYSVTLGNGNDVDSYGGTALGLLNDVSGSYATAVGRSNDAIGVNSFVAGWRNEAKSGFEVVFGRYNDSPDVINSETDWNGNDQLFVIGNGNNSIARSNALTVLKNGDVAIGNNFADGFRLSVDGKVMAEEVQVQLSGAWPDYVFTKEYDLLSIGQLASYIDQNNHLPNIPSAAEIEKEGIAIGEMNKKLMEKIEELTLYVIELNAQNEKMASRLSKLEMK